MLWLCFFNWKSPGPLVAFLIVTALTGAVMDVVVDGLMVV
jgi:hypothetical protein